MKTASEVTSKQRAERAYRARRLAAGDKLLRVWMTPKTRLSWLLLVDRYGTGEAAFADAVRLVMDNQTN